MWAAKWRRADGTRVKRRLGAAAWLERDGDGWRPRGGQPKPGHLSERQARRLMASVIHGTEAALDAAALAPDPMAAAGPRFRELTQTWLHHLAAVDDVKPWTLRNYGFMLAEPGTPHRRGGMRTRPHHGRPW